MHTQRRIRRPLPATAAAFAAASAAAFAAASAAAAADAANAVSRRKHQPGGQWPKWRMKMLMLLSLLLLLLLLLCVGTRGVVRGRDGGVRGLPAQQSA